MAIFALNYFIFMLSFKVFQLLYLAIAQNKTYNLSKELTQFG